MTTQKQIEANKNNAQQSTGPSTEEGKAVSRYNAIKHGLLSREVLLEGEDEEALLELGKRLRGELSPASELEQMLVDRIVSNFWRLRRAMSLEEENVLKLDHYGVENKASAFFRYEALLERGIYKALHELQRLQAARNGEKVIPPVAVDIDVSGEK